VVVSAWSVRVAVRALVFGSRANRENFDVEGERHTREWMVAIDLDVAAADPDDPNGQRLAPRPFCHELHSDLDLDVVGEGRARDFLRAPLALAVTLQGRNHGLALVARAAPPQP